MNWLDHTLLPSIEMRCVILLAALALDGLLGEPDWLWSRVKHPIVIIGNLIGYCDTRFNEVDNTPGHKRASGIVTLGGLVLFGVAITVGVSALLQTHPTLGILEVVAVAIFLATRSLHDHVATVATALRDDGLTAGRRAVSHIVGRDPEQLDESGVSRAAIESTAENFADGVVAPAFWYLIAGLPGIVLYKIINTADSMIGHKTDRHREFGWAAARLDDLVNLLPARLSGLLIIFAAALPGQRTSARAGFTTMWRDAGKHASPNAGWPETAMAGAMGIALAGPRKYPEYTSTDAWLNEHGRHALDHKDISSSARTMVTATVAMAVSIAAIFVFATL